MDKHAGTNAVDTRDLMAMVRFGADSIFRSTQSTVTDDDIVCVEGH